MNINKHKQILTKHELFTECFVRLQLCMRLVTVTADLVIYFGKRMAQKNFEKFKDLQNNR